MQADSGISIVIPAYNAEQYIEQCINSLLEQTYANFEIICVENGSTDRTARVLDELAAKDYRIQVIHISRCTAGAARNQGMDKAVGKYLLFLDADDFFEPGMLEAVYKKAENAGAQICLFGARDYKEDSDQCNDWNHINMKYVPDSMMLSGKDNPDIFQISTAHPWNKLFSRQLVIETNARFQDIGRCNDVYFVFLVLTSAGRIVIDPEEYVHYRQHDSSLQATNDESPLDWCIAYSALRKELVKRGDYDRLRIGFQNLCLSVTWYNFDIMKTHEGYVTLYSELLHTYFNELDLENMDPSDVYDYNNLIYEFICEMRTMTPDEMLWNKSHRMVRECQQAMRDAIRRKDEEIESLKERLSVEPRLPVEDSAATRELNNKISIKERMQRRCPASRRFIERRMAEQDKQIKKLNLQLDNTIEKLQLTQRIIEGVDKSIIEERRMVGHILKIISKRGG